LYLKTLFRLLLNTVCHQQDFHELLAAEQAGGKSFMGGKSEEAVQEVPISSLRVGAVGLPHPSACEADTPVREIHCLSTFSRGIYRFG
jgi:hypothetical protein